MSRKPIILFVEYFRRVITQIENPLLTAFVSTFLGLIVATILGLILYPNVVYIGWIMTILIGFPISYFITGQTNEFRNKIEAERLKARIEQERIQILATFIQNASHEFRTPLSLIKTNTYLLSHSTDMKKQEKRIEKIVSAVDTIDLLVETMLRLTKLDSVIDYPSHILPLSSLLPTLENNFKQNQQKSLSLIINCASNLPSICANQEDLLFALEQILTNAAQASPENGVVTINVYVADNTLNISVRDNGGGMSHEVMDKMFERFYRYDESHTTYGMGLGLPIAKRIVELHQGTIDVESTLGEYTSVTVSLPIPTKKDNLNVSMFSAN